MKDIVFCGLNVTVIKSRRKTVEYRFTDENNLVLKVPSFFNESMVEDALKKKERWIKNTLARIEQENDGNSEKLTVGEMNKLMDDLAEYLRPKLEYYARLMGVTFNGVHIKHQKGRWGSCSGKGNLNFNCLIMLMPEYVRDYVIVHELCHLKEMNHSPAFYALVEQYCPDYKTAVKWLNTNGNKIMKRNF